MNDNNNNNNKKLALLAEAQQLRQRAQELKQEARQLELELATSRSYAQHKRAADAAQWMRLLFASTPETTTTPETVARILRQERFSEDQVLLLFQDLYRRRREAQTIVPLSSTTTTTTVDMMAAAAAVNQTEAERIQWYMTILLNATAILDQETTTDTAVGDSTPVDSYTTTNYRWSGRVYSQLQSRWNEWDRAADQNVQRLVAASVQAALQNNNKNNNNYSAVVTEYVRRSLGLTSSSGSSTDSNGSLSPAANNNITVTTASAAADSEESISLVPRWIPASLLPFVLASPSRLNSVDVRIIKERVLPQTRFFCTSSDSTATAAIFRGNLRLGVNVNDNNNNNNKDSTAAVLAEIQTELERAGLAERLQLFLLPDPEWVVVRDQDPRASERRPKPVLIALPHDVNPDDSVVRQSLSSRLVKKASLVLALSAAMTYSFRQYALNPIVFDAVVHEQSLSMLLRRSGPIFLGIMALQAVHELAHRWVAHRRGIKIGLPLLIPSAQVGTFGCITPLRSFPPNRSALLDLALSGPVSAMLLSLLLMMMGCYQTVAASPARLAQFPVVPVALLKSSFLSGSMLTFLLPKAMLLPLSQPIPIHREYKMMYNHCGYRGYSLHFLTMQMTD